MDSYFLQKDDLYDYNKQYNQDNYYPDEEEDILDDEALLYDDDLDYRPTSSSSSSGTLKILMVAEKGSIAKSIAQALVKDNYRQSKGKIANYYFHYEFQGQPCDIVVSATNGHLYSCDFPKKYQDWQSVEPYQLFRVETTKVPCQTGIIKNLQQQSKNANILMLWLDCDREGENICFEVKNLVKNNLVPKKGIPLYLRAKFSSLASSDLIKAYRNIRDPPDELKSLSVDARQILDLKIGVSLSRFQTIYFNKKYPQLNKKLITFGPCQTPTLGFCIERYDEIRNFQSKQYFTLSVNLQSQSDQYTAHLQTDGYIFQESIIRDIQKKTQEQQYLTVSSYSSKTGYKQRPEGLNTVSMLRLASTHLGLGPHQTMQMAERLYLSQFITYPRTETTHYPANFDFDEVLVGQKKNPDDQISEYARKLKMVQPKKGVDVGDHPPITPTGKQFQMQGNGELNRLYRLICVQFLSSISPDAEFTNLHVNFKNNYGTFSTSGVILLNPSFTILANHLSIQTTNQNLQKLKDVKELKIVSSEVKTNQTQPPGYLTESELISLMEKHAIGTDASMATHIHNICVREYVKIDKGRKLVPTKLGIALVHGYQQIDQQLVSPQLRSDMENQVDLIAKGNKKFEEVLRLVEGVWAEKYKILENNIQKMENLLLDGLGEISASITVNKTQQVRETKAIERKYLVHQTDQAKLSDFVEQLKQKEEERVKEFEQMTNPDDKKSKKKKGKEKINKNKKGEDDLY